jgi:hypothetical protein
LVESLRSYGHGLKGCTVVCLGLGGRDVADGLEKAAVVEPVDTGKGREFNSLDAFPGRLAVDHLGFVEAVDRFRECVVIRISNASNGRFDACVGQALGVSNAHVLRSLVRVMNEAAFADRLSGMQGLFKRIQYKVCPCIA